MAGCLEVATEVCTTGFEGISQPAMFEETTVMAIY